MVNKSVCALACIITVMSARLGAQSVAVVGQPEGEARAALVSVSVDGMPLQHVLKSISQQAGLTPFYSTAVTNSSAKVTLHVKNVSVLVAFEKALDGTGVRASIVNGKVLFEPSASTPALVVQGGISGKIVDGKTKQPLHGATITLDDATRGTTSGDNGTFRIANVAPGSHTIRIRMLGYMKATRTAVIVDDQVVAIDVALDPAVSALDQVVVTGTVTPTAQKAVPNAMTVITAADIARRGITHIDQLFRGDVPGLFVRNGGSGNSVDQVTMFSRGSTSLTGGTTAIKTYVDGIELADPSYLSQIDPRSIERIEIVTGPQASTIYGSNAINGVMQVFTKRGASAKPQFTASLLSGTVQNDLSSAITSQHDYSAQLSGTQGRTAYQVGGAWVYIGPWSPAKQTATTSGFGGTRMQFGALSADASIRLSSLRTRKRGTLQQLRSVRALNGDAHPDENTIDLREIPSLYTLGQQTLGLTLSYAAASWWSHELVVGTDASNWQDYQIAPAYWLSGSADSLLVYQQSRTTRTSLRYATTANIPVTSWMQAVVTLGADGWQNLGSTIAAQPAALTGTLSGVYNATRLPGHNTGTFFQGQFGVRDALFLTYGLRAEWNPNYGNQVGATYAPRYGVAYTKETGPVTTKLRFSYGRATRPPTIDQKNQLVAQSATYGRYVQVIASPLLGPEYQQGGEGGLEMYLGTRASVVVTRYNQTVDNLIARPRIDSVPSLVPDITGAYTYNGVYQSLNIGSLRNEGWELQGTVNTGSLSTKSTYSWTKSRVIGLAPEYRNRTLLGSGGQYTPGGSFTYLPEHTWAVNSTYASAGTTLSLNINGTGKLFRDFDDLYNAINHTRLDANKPRMSSSGYRSFDPAYTMLDFNASQRFSPHVEGVLQVQNLTDVYRDDVGQGYATIGRQTKAGFRIRW